MDRVEVVHRGTRLARVGPDPFPHRLATRPRLVVDANVFAHRAWIAPLMAEADAGRLELYWSPRIIAEASRVLAWIWLRKRGGDMSSTARRELSDVAHRWFDTMTGVFRVVEDAPPAEPIWTALPRDPHDRAVWSAAVRVDADALITENLKDEPPPDEHGVRRWADILYVHPREVVDLFDVVARAVGPDRRHGTIESDVRPSRREQSVAHESELSEALSPTTVELLRALERRAHESFVTQPPE